MKHLLIAALMISGAVMSAQAADCGKVTIADMNWNSATLLSHIERFILEHAYGCDADLVPADPMPTGAAMVELGSPDIAPEVWAGSMGDAMDKGVAARQLVIAGHSLADGGEEGFWVPAYMVEKDASLATIEGIRKKASLFASADHPGKSFFYGCPAGWSCQISTGNLFEALKLSDAGFEMVEPGSAAGLADSLARAYEGKEPWFGYYWSPTAILGKYRMKKVDFGTGIDETHYRDCITHKECMDPQATMFPSTAIQVVATSAFAKTHPEIMEFLGRLSLRNDEMNELLAWMEDNRADGKAAANHFLRNYEAVWSRWLSEDEAAKIRSAVAGME
ncbi:ABC transporter substrate-binding protein [uncultured Cohaesibacter sp.]|uniref:ABC transporter substrate-binding protein n=1 Tax=uncultured Cohaesibacter sp. TaxID=1002546 RepID=UPI0029C95A6A|nr:ABC transporter substrate-binding protein [uncultured Cohaesibacter sp.]